MHSSEVSDLPSAIRVHVARLVPGAVPGGSESARRSGASDADPPAGKPDASSGPGATGWKRTDPPTKTVVLNEPIVVKAGETFDGKGVRYVAGPGLGDGSQKENQKPLFIVEPGGTVKNLQYQGGDGIHFKGSGTLQNVNCVDVGEDAVTLKGSGTLNVVDCSFAKASDKVFQINASGRINLTRVDVDGAGNVLRVNGGKQLHTDVTFKDCDFRNVRQAIHRSDSKHSTVSFTNVNAHGTPLDYKNTSRPGKPASDPPTDKPDPPAGKPDPSSGPGATGWKRTDPPTKTVVLNEPIVVKAGETFDGKGVRYVAGPGLGDGSQKENQKPLFIVEPGGKVKNLQYQGGDGIHFKGSGTLQNVNCVDVGEDAVTLKGPGTLNVVDCSFAKASDKVFQINASGRINLTRVDVDGAGKVLRVNGGKQLHTDVTFTDCDFRNVREAIHRSDSKYSTVSFTNVNAHGTRLDYSK